MARARRRRLRTVSPRPLTPRGMWGATAANGTWTSRPRSVTALPGRGAWGVWGGPFVAPHLQMAYPLLRRRLGTAQPALENLAGDGAAAQPEGQRERQHHAAERDAERDEHHLLADAQV